MESLSKQTQPKERDFTRQDNTEKKNGKLNYTVIMVDSVSGHKTKTKVNANKNNSKRK